MIPSVSLQPKLCARIIHIQRGEKLREIRLLEFGQFAVSAVSATATRSLGPAWRRLNSSIAKPRKKVQVCPGTG